MKWHKIGHVYSPKGNKSWARSHAYIPTAILRDEYIRVFFACRDAHQIGRIGYIDVDTEDPTKILHECDDPVFDIGDPGSFDDNGVSPLSIVQTQSELRLYYVGWQLGHKVRYFMFTGLAQSSDGGQSFRRFQTTPILDRCPGERILRSGGTVHQRDGKWHMWYMAGDQFVEGGSARRPWYLMKHIVSHDGIQWSGESKTCMTPNVPDEFGFGRPAVVEDANGRLHMWYSIRTHSKGYRIGYGNSDDASHWNRCDHQSGIDVGPSSWDCETIFAANIVIQNRTAYMFYNGNDYGRTGFGVAKAKLELQVP